MKLTQSIALVFICALLGLSSCGTPDTAPPPVNQSTNTARAFYPGRRITFPQPPTEDAITRLKLAKAREESSTTYIVEKYDRHDDLQSMAFEQAYRENAMTSGWRAAP